ncbi:MAG: TOBE domain-containing protein [Deltaproteobacteria bacterium]|nr:TOBE domain-containing protein [Deltaproteobacteria bacterium]
MIIDCGAFQLDPGPRANLQNGQPAAARIHARNIILATEPPVRLSAQNVISGRVSRLATAGGEMLVHIDSGQSVIAEVTPRAVKELELREGQSIYWIVKSHSIAVDA